MGNNPVESSGLLWTPLDFDWTLSPVDWTGLDWTGLQWTGLCTSQFGLAKWALESTGVRWSPVESSGVHMDYMGEGKDLCPSTGLDRNTSFATWKACSSLAPHFQWLCFRKRLNRGAQIDA